MSGNISTRAMFQRRAIPVLFLAALSAAFLIGCGGGGGDNSGGVNNGGFNNNGGGQNSNASVIGKIMDTQGNGVPGVSVIPDSGGGFVTSVSQGGYEIDGLTGSVVHRITAAVVQNGVSYSGSTQALTLSNSLISNVNILLSRQDRQATVSGTVRDNNGTPIPGVRLFLAVPNNASFSSLVAFTDRVGSYSIPNVPIDLPASSAVTVTASTESAQNQTFTLPSLGAGSSYRQDFQLSGSTNQGVSIPTIDFVNAFTQPSDALSGLSRSARATQGSVYEQIRRLLSPSYARMMEGHSARHTSRVAHLSGFGSSLIETDIAFNEPVQTGSVFAFTVYRTQGANHSPQQTSADVYDVLQDPQANFYTDISPDYVPNAQFNFALSATNTDRVETPLSASYSVVPLGPLTLTQPQTGQSLSNAVTLTWNAVPGASKYYVLIYNQYPGIDTTPVYATPTGAPLAGNVTRLTLPNSLPSGSAYYAVVAGTADQTENTAQSVFVPNAVATFSQITRFSVP